MSSFSESTIGVDFRIGMSTRSQTRVTSTLSTEVFLKALNLTDMSIVPGGGTENTMNLYNRLVVESEEMQVKCPCAEGFQLPSCNVKAGEDFLLVASTPTWIAEDQGNVQLQWVPVDSPLGHCLELPPPLVPVDGSTGGGDSNAPVLEGAKILTVKVEEGDLLIIRFEKRYMGDHVPPLMIIVDFYKEEEKPIIQLKLPMPLEERIMRRNTLKNLPFERFPEKEETVRAAYEEAKMRVWDATLARFQHEMTNHATTDAPYTNTLLHLQSPSNRDLIRRSSSVVERQQAFFREASEAYAWSLSADPTTKCVPLIYCDEVRKIREGKWTMMEAWAVINRVDAVLLSMYDEANDVYGNL